MLGGLRVLDLTTEKGFLCGRVLADLGADVIKVEKPGGDASRLIGPFYHDEADPRKSLYWFFYNAGKRGITLDIEQPRGREIFKKLAAKADVVVESFAAGYMDGIGLGYSELSRNSPALIMTAITPYGYNHPYRNHRTSDLVSTAASGYLWLVGDRDRPPVRISFPQAYQHAGAQAASAVLVARAYQRATGKGQFIDVSIQGSMVQLTTNAINWWALCGNLLHREGQYRPAIWGINARGIWRCQDGFVAFIIGGGERYARWNKLLVKWMASEGMDDDFLKGINWDSFDMVAPQDFSMNDIEERVARFFLKHTKAELYQWGVENGVGIYPAYATGDLFKDRQLKEREFWTGVYHSELKETITYPSSFVRSSETVINIKRRAPLIGEHNDEIYGELGLSAEETEGLKRNKII